MQVILSTRNPSKVEQAMEVFVGSSIEVIGLDEAGIRGEAMEDGQTLEQNALKKALFAHQQRPDLWAMADDTGIFIDALGGKPGVHTAVWNGGNQGTEQKTLWILDQLKNANVRTATFKTVVCVVSPQGKEHFFSGEIIGMLLREPRDARQPKMPYAPIFLPEGSDKVWGQMSVQEENAISHRGQAFRQAREFLEQQKE